MPAPTGMCAARAPASSFSSRSRAHWPIGDRIYALIRATAVNQDGRTEGISVPSRASQEANIARRPAAGRYRAGERAIRGGARDRNAGRRPDRGRRARGGLWQGTKTRGPLRDRLDQEQHGSPGSGCRHRGIDQGGAVPAASPDSGEPALRESESANPLRRSAAARCAATGAVARNLRAAAACGRECFRFRRHQRACRSWKRHPRPSSLRACMPKSDDGRAWMLPLSARSAPALVRSGAVLSDCACGKSVA